MKWSSCHATTSFYDRREYILPVAKNQKGCISSSKIGITLDFIHIPNI
ncbi:hypothetical protein [Brachyspira pilosicoli]|nr:hypothetical protein [Brachyspira pilosicoli]